MLINRAAPAAEKERRRQRRDNHHIDVFRQEKHGELETRIFGMKTGGQFRFGFGHIKRRAIGFGDAAREIGQTGNQH